MSTVTRPNNWSLRSDSASVRGDVVHAAGTQDVMLQQGVPEPDVKGQDNER
jgi:hypothetical protein